MKLTLGTNSRSAAAAASFFLLSLLISFGLTSASTDLTDQVAEEKSTCRTGLVRTPHQRSLWNIDFPNDESVEALCEGSVDVQDNGEICITGRVSYKQVAEAVDKPIRAPAASSISVTGHLTTGIPNVVLGYEANYLYDYVTSYKVGDDTFFDASDITNNLLGASFGIIEEVCLDSSFAKDEEVYSISHDLWLPPGKAVEEKYTDASVLFISATSIVAEYHKPSDLPPIFGAITSFIVALSSNFAPAWIFNYVPFLGFSGLFRLLVFGTVSTAKFPQPLVAPDNLPDDIQIDTKWTVLMDAMADGLFTKDLAPLYFSVIIKKLSASSSSNGCFKEDTAAIDITAPSGYGPKLDEYVDEVVLPALVKAGGQIGLHMGKRLKSDSDYLNAAYEFYSSLECGVQLNIDPANCYHPACERKSTVSEFEYPPGLFQEAKK